MSQHEIADRIEAAMAKMNATIANRIEVVTAKMQAAYEERDRHAANGNEFLARDWDDKATALDLLRVRLQNMLEE